LARTTVGEQGRQLGALVGCQLTLGCFDSAKECDLEIRPDLCRLADLGLCACDIHRFVWLPIQESPQLHSRNYQVCLPPDRLTHDVEAETPEAFHL
jgi:hypothetical protein